MRCLESLEGLGELKMLKDAYREYIRNEWWLDGRVERWVVRIYVLMYWKLRVDKGA